MLMQIREFYRLFQLQSTTQSVPPVFHQITLGHDEYDIFYSPNRPETHHDTNPLSLYPSLAFVPVRYHELVLTVTQGCGS
jgi:hypothetical protein